MKTIGLLSMVAAAAVLFSGCAKKSELTPEDQEVRRAVHSQNRGGGEVEQVELAPYRLNIKPLVGSRSNDAKVIVDTGRVLKVYIASYKQNATLIAAHDIYTFVTRPDFIVGESVPTRGTDAVVTPARKLPYMLTPDELDVDTDERELTDEEVKRYVNGVYSVQAEKEEPLREKVKAMEKKEAELMRYLKEKGKVRWEQK
ncbi:hypothetical protein ACXWTF_13160 [Thiomicrolovo sp. ZZH C-3]